MTLDFHSIDPNPAKDARIKLLKERKPHVPPPLAEHVERIAERLPGITFCHYWSSMNVARVNELATALVGDLDEHRRAIRVRWTVDKNDRYRLLELPDDLFDALVAVIPPREDRDLDAPLFPDLTDARHARQSRKPAK